MKRSKSQSHAYLAFNEWLLWQAALPLFCIFAFWPVSACLTDAKFAFEQSFAAGDPIIYAALLLLSVYCQFRGLTTSDDDEKADIRLQMQWVLVFAMMALLAFACVKLYIIQKDYFSMQPLPGRITEITYFNLTVAVTALILSARTYWTAALTEIG